MRRCCPSTQNLHGARDAVCLVAERERQREEVVRCAGPSSHMPSHDMSFDDVMSGRRSYGVHRVSSLPMTPERRTTTVGRPYRAGRTGRCRRAADDAAGRDTGGGGYRGGTPRRAGTHPVSRRLPVRGRSAGSPRVRGRARGPAAGLRQGHDDASRPALSPARQQSERRAPSAARCRRLPQSTCSVRLRTF
jgi:hypothetical protein